MWVFSISSRDNSIVTTTSIRNSFNSKAEGMSDKEDFTLQALIEFEIRKRASRQV